jgi:hypothetical protein
MWRQIMKNISYEELVFMGSQFNEDVMIAAYKYKKEINNMEFGTLTSEGKIINTRTVNQGRLSSECWSVQFSGLEACNTCEQKNKKGCGGKQIRKTGKNEKGFSVPV